MDQIQISEVPSPISRMGPPHGPWASPGYSTSKKLKLNAIRLSVINTAVGSSDVGSGLVFVII